MTWHTRRLLKRLTTCAFPAEQAEAAKAQIADIVAYHVASFSTTKDIDEQMKAVAFDCYVQGLLDGAQVAPLVHSEPSVCRNDVWPGGVAKCPRWCGMNYCKPAALISPMNKRSF